MLSEGDNLAERFGDFRGEGPMRKKSSPRYIQGGGKECEGTEQMRICAGKDYLQAVFITTSMNSVFLYP